jgi:hypothetical protein
MPFGPAELRRDLRMTAERGLRRAERSEKQVPPLRDPALTKRAQEKTGSLRSG